MADFDSNGETRPKMESAGTCPPASVSLPSFPGFEVLEIIGSGGMGVVYKARQLGLDRFVAIKTIRSRILAEDDDWIRFQREVNSLGQLNDPNIVTVYEVSSRVELPYYSMEICTNGSLHSLYSQSPADFLRAAELCVLITRALDRVHGLGVIHRDIKPSNILMDSQWNPKISDFGLAKSLEDSREATTSGQILGSPSFMAPEMTKPRLAKVDPRLDVYGVGGVLYYLLTSRPPFLNSDVLDTLWDVTNNEPIPPSRIRRRTPGDLETICLKCLEKNPEKRYPTVKELELDLLRFLEGRPILARPASWLEKSAKWVKRQPVVAGLLAAVVSSLALGLAGTLWQLGKSREAKTASDKSFLEARQARGQELLRRQALEQVIQTTISDLAELSLLEAPPRGSTQRKLLESLLENIEKAYQGDDPWIREDPLRHWQGRLRISQIQFQLGYNDKAMANIQEILAGLSDVPSSDLDLFMVETGALLQQGGHYFQEKRWTESIRCFQLAFSRAGQMQGANPNPSHTHILFSACKSLADALGESGQDEEALDLTKKAMTYFSLLKGTEKESLARLGMGSLWNSLSMIQARKRKFELALSSQDKAMDQLLTAVGENPGNPVAVKSYLALLNNRATTLMTAGKVQESLVAMEKVVKELKLAANRFPALLELKEKQCGVLRNKGAILIALGENDASLAPLQESVELAREILTEFPSQHATREHLVVVLQMMNSVYQVSKNHEKTWATAMDGLAEILLLQKNSKANGFVDKAVYLVQAAQKSARNLEFNTSGMSNQLSAFLAMQSSLFQGFKEPVSMAVPMNHFLVDLGVRRLRERNPEEAATHLQAAWDYRVKIPMGYSSEKSSKDWILSNGNNLIKALLAMNKLGTARQWAGKVEAMVGGLFLEKPSLPSEKNQVALFLVSKAKLAAFAGDLGESEKLLDMSAKLTPTLEGSRFQFLLLALQGKAQEARGKFLRLLARKSLPDLADFEMLWALAVCSNTPALEKSLVEEYRQLFGHYFDQMLFAKAPLAPRELALLEKDPAFLWVRTDARIGPMVSLWVSYSSGGKTAAVLPRP